MTNVKMKRLFSWVNVVFVNLDLFRGLNIQIPFMNKAVRFILNFQDDIPKLRIAQALILLVPHVTCDPKVVKNDRNIKTDKANNDCKRLRRLLKKITVGILVQEARSQNGATRQICQYMYVLLSQFDLSFRGNYD